MAPLLAAFGEAAAKASPIEIVNLASTNLWR